jgi:hypothetical protein
MDMRPPNNGKRGRSRGRSKGPHTHTHHHHGHGNLNRTLESNGPDVKIRGTAAHIHEKYLTLARDAHSSGDRIGAENYLQHAEHYQRLMAGMTPPGQPYQPGVNQNQGGVNGGLDAGGDDDGPSPGQGGYQSQGTQQQSGQHRGGQPQHQQSQPAQQPPQAQPQQTQPQQNRSEGEEALAFDRRLNGRSRRVGAENRGDRAITTPERGDEPKGGRATPADQSGAADEGSDDSDEALV